MQSLITPPRSRNWKIGEGKEVINRFERGLNDRRNRTRRGKPSSSMTDRGYPSECLPPPIFSFLSRYFLSRIEVAPVNTRQVVGARLASSVIRGRFVRVEPLSNYTAAYSDRREGRSISLFIFSKRGNDQEERYALFDRFRIRWKVLFRGAGVVVGGSGLRGGGKAPSSH